MSSRSPSSMIQWRNPIFSLAPIRIMHNANEVFRISSWYNFSQSQPTITQIRPTHNCDLLCDWRSTRQLYLASHLRLSANVCPIRNTLAGNRRLTDYYRGVMPYIYGVSRRSHAQQQLINTLACQTYNTKGKGKESSRCRQTIDNKAMHTCYLLVQRNKNSFKFDIKTLNIFCWWPRCALHSDTHPITTSYNTIICVIYE